MTSTGRAWAVVLEAIGWVGVMITTITGICVAVVTVQVCRELARLDGVHGGYGIDLVVGIVVLAVVAVFWLVAVACIVGGRCWRRPRVDRRTQPSPAPPRWSANGW